jgi:hypothetical protein
VCKGDIGRLDIGGPPRAGAVGPGPGAPGGVAGGSGGPGAAPAIAGGGGSGAPAGPRATGPGGLPGGGSFGGGAGGVPAEPPVVLSRDGKEYAVTRTSIRAGTEIKVTTERPSVNLNVTELDAGSWVVLELPGFTTAALGTEQSSLDALRKASDTSYYKGKDALWVKVVSSGDPGTGAPNSGTSLLVSR